MTRKSRREIERALEDLGGGGADTWDYLIVREDDDTGDLVDMDGEPVDNTDLEGANQVVIFSEEIIETEWSADE